MRTLLKNDLAKVSGGVSIKKGDSITVTDDSSYSHCGLSFNSDGTVKDLTNMVTVLEVKEGGESACLFSQCVKGYLIPNGAFYYLYKED